MKVAITYFKDLSQHIPEKIEENHENLWAI